MEKFTVGSVVLVSFPFSNLKGKKIRPALVVAQGEFDNLILCQITSKSYSSKTAISIEQSDFAKGMLPLKSFVRPDKLFTSDVSILRGKAGELASSKKRTILQKVCKLFYRIIDINYKKIAHQFLLFKRKGSYFVAFSINYLIGNDMFII